MKKGLVLGVVATLLVQVAAVGWLIARYESVVRNGTEIRIPCRAYDPSDPFRGRYLRVSTTQQTETIESDVSPADLYHEHRHSRCWAVELVPSTNGLWQVARVAERPSGDGVWFRPTSVTFDYSVTWRDRGNEEEYEDFNKRRVASPLVARIEFPDQLFVNEHKAKEAEKLVNKALKNGKPVIGVYKVGNGRIVMTGLEVDGKPVAETARSTVSARSTRKEGIG